MTTVKVISHRKEVTENIIDGLQKGLERTGLIVERQARINVSKATGHPQVQTGRLRASILHNVNPGEVEIGTNVVYGKYLEFGTVKMPPYSWLFVAVESSKQDIIKALKGSYTVTAEVPEIRK